MCCRCETDCDSKKCGCRKHGLRCKNLCMNCHGSESCSNIEKKIYGEFSDSQNIDDVEEAVNLLSSDENDGTSDDEDLDESVALEDTEEMNNCYEEETDEEEQSSEILRLT